MANRKHGRKFGKRGNRKGLGKTKAPLSKERKAKPAPQRAIRTQGEYTALRRSSRIYELKKELMRKNFMEVMEGRSTEPPKDEIIAEVIGQMEAENQTRFYPERKIQNTEGNPSENQSPEIVDTPASAPAEEVSAPPTEPMEEEPESSSVQVYSKAQQHVSKYLQLSGSSVDERKWDILTRYHKICKDCKGCVCFCRPQDTRTILNKFREQVWNTRAKTSNDVKRNSPELWGNLDADLQELFQVTPTEQDGSSVYSAVSLALFGDEKYSTLLRICSGLEYAKHFDFYQNVFKNFIPEVELDDVEKVNLLARIVYEETWGGRDSIYILARAIGININLISYPSTKNSNRSLNCNREIFYGSPYKNKNAPHVSILSVEREYFALLPIPKTLINTQEYDFDHGGQTSYESAGSMQRSAVETPEESVNLTKISPPAANKFGRKRSNENGDGYEYPIKRIITAENRLLLATLPASLPNRRIILSRSNGDEFVRDLQEENLSAEQQCQKVFDVSASLQNFSINEKENVVVHEDNYQDEEMIIDDSSLFETNDDDWIMDEGEYNSYDHITNIDDVVIDVEDGDVDMKDIDTETAQQVEAITVYSGRFVTVQGQSTSCNAIEVSESKVENVDSEMMDFIYDNEYFRNFFTT